MIDYYNYFVSEKIQTNKINDIMLTYNKIFYQVTVNTFIYIIPFCVIGGIYDMNYDMYFSIKKCIFDIILGIPLIDIFFYLLHKLFHTKYLYPYHKKHHEIIAPIGMSALYMSVTDMYFGNILPVILPALILSYHPITIKVWIAMAIINTITLAHSGFKRISDFHDYHHETFNKNFGTNIFMDKLFGTFN